MRSAAHTRNQKQARALVRSSDTRGCCWCGVGEGGCCAASLLPVDRHSADPPLPDRWWWGRGSGALLARASDGMCRGGSAAAACEDGMLVLVLYGGPGGECMLRLCAGGTLVGRAMYVLVRACLLVQRPPIQRALSDGQPSPAGSHHNRLDYALTVFFCNRSWPKPLDLTTRARSSWHPGHLRDREIRWL
jgi:hypothetical protein